MVVVGLLLVDLDQNTYPTLGHRLGLPLYVEHWIAQLHALV